jgi:hypothetical protein
MTKREERQAVEIIQAMCGDCRPFKEIDTELKRQLPHLGERERSAAWETSLREPAHDQG